jgi:carbon storage regulator
MLILTRRVNESIVIDDQIVVQVISVKGDKVRLGIAAPRDVVVDRQEVHERRREFTAEPAVCK